MRFIPILLISLVAGCGLFSNPDEVELRAPDRGPDLDMSVSDEGRANNETPDAPPDADVDVPATCGDGLLQPEEVCDPLLPPESPGACPSTCDDGAACTTDELVGAANTCNAACQAIPIEACENNDGCCPANCSPTNDTDCDENAVCGDGVVTGAETCDPGIDAVDAGGCPGDPAACSTGQCQMPRVIGAPQNCDAECAFVEVTTCVSDDDCCPPGCDESNDMDCASVCGNGTIEPGEGCDGNCPAPSDCDDGEACTINEHRGSVATCDARCVATEILTCTDDDGCCPSNCDSGNDNDCSASCGNDVLDPGETCDPSDTCPTDCIDGDACTFDNGIGSASNCNVVCQHTPITTCAAISDGCCPSSCNANNDADCTALCGNGVIEEGETCDGNCPTDCDDDNACTVDSMSGAPDACTIECANNPITLCSDGDGCCPAGCNAINDDDCGAVCGNAITEPGELCDGNCPPTCNDGNACTVDIRNGSAAQCNVACTYLFVSSCVNADGCCPSGCNANNDSDCSPTCGNGVTEGNETCDGNCPIAQACVAVSACSQLTGSAAQCSAQCQPITGCQPCSVDDACTCPANEVCSGICEESDGSRCDRACDPAAYCEAWAGPQSFCNVMDGTCVECRAVCEPYLICRGTECLQPASCSQSPEPDAWCAAFKGGGTCFGDTCS